MSRFRRFAAAAMLAGGAATVGRAQGLAPAIPSATGYAPVNGLRMYYEVYGPLDRVPLVLLNGGGSTIDVTYGRILPWLAKGRTVIALEEQAHGRTSDRDRPERFESSADDVAALLAFLKVDRADVMGFSNGASVALEVTLRHPTVVRKLIFASSMTKRDGARPELWDAMRTATFATMPQPLKDAFLKVNPNPRQLRVMCERDIERMRNFQDVPDREVASIRVPTLVMVGDRDVVKVEHAVELSQLIPGARLMVFPGGHGDYLAEALAPPRDPRYPEFTAAVIGEFLDAPSGGAR